MIDMHIPRLTSNEVITRYIGLVVKPYVTCWVAVLFLLCSSVGRADEKLEPPAKRLASVSTFAFGDVGFAGVISKGELDFKLVLSQPVPLAISTFEKLFAAGNPQAKAYALVGMNKLNQDRYKKLLTATYASTSQVAVMRGCIMTYEPLHELAKEIDSGKLRF